MKIKIFNNQKQDISQDLKDATALIQKHAGITPLFFVEPTKENIQPGITRDGCTYPDERWFVRAFSKKATGHDFAVAVYSDAEAKKAGFTKGGTSLSNSAGPSEIFMRFTPGTKRETGDGKVSEFTARLLHEMCHGMFDHILKIPDRTHEFDLFKNGVHVNKNLVGALKLWRLAELTPTLPLKNYFALRRGYRHGSPTHYNNFHLGVDIFVPVGTPVFAPVAGVCRSLFGSQGGNTVHLEGAGKTFRFLHLMELGKSGQVSQGEVIGWTGNTGISTVPHLHLDISNGKLNLNDRHNFIDPDEFFRVQIQTTIASLLKKVLQLLTLKKQQ